MVPQGAIVVSAPQGNSAIVRGPGKAHSSTQGPFSHDALLGTEACIYNGFTILDGASCQHWFYSNGDVTNDDVIEVNLP